MKRTCGAVLFLALALTACGQEDEAPEDNGAPEADPTPDADVQEGDDTYVFNSYGDEQGFADQEPEDYVATEFTTFTDVEWDEWTEETAQGEGEVSGTWCMDEDCVEDPYDVEIELGEPVDVGGTPYFSTYTVTDHDMPEGMPEAMEDADGGLLALPVEEEGEEGGADE